jgi:hypothetical protein
MQHPRCMITKACTGGVLLLCVTAFLRNRHPFPHSLPHMPLVHKGVVASENQRAILL